MPAKPPALSSPLAVRLERLGRQVRDHRKRLKISATTVAEAAGLSRVTLHRIERGEPSVTMGAYANALAALGLEIAVVDPAQAQRHGTPASGLPPTVRLADYPQLQRLAWHLHVDEVAPAEALDLYERNWRHVDHAAMDERERALVDALARALRGGRPLV